MSTTPPLDTSTLTRVGGQLGSNPAGIYQDKRGQRYYVKMLESAAHARNEWIAAQLYRLAGAPTLNYIPTVAGDQIATRWMDLQKKCVAHLNADERRQAQRWLAVHAWTANWDAAGFNGDNQGVTQGTVITLDVGGALAFRACGDPKGKAFGSRVSELDTLREDPDNPHAVALFAGMNNSDIAESITRVTGLDDQTIANVITTHGGSRALVEKMLARKADLQKRLVSYTLARS